MKILEAHGLKYVRFPASQMGVYLDNIGENLAKPHTAAEVLQLCPEAEAIIDGPMFEIADGSGEYATYKKGRLDYRYLDTHDGDDASGGTATDRKGCTLSIVDGVPGWSDGDSVEKGADVAVQFYPALVRNGVVIASATVNTSTVWRAGVGTIGNEVVFAVGNMTMNLFATAMLALGCKDAGYTDGGGSARLAVREKGVPSAGSSENRRCPSWISCEPNRDREEIEPVPAPSPAPAPTPSPAPSTGSLPYKASLLPSRYWRDWMPRVEKRWLEYSVSLQKLQAGGLLPGVMSEILVAFTAPASPTENTTDARTGLGAEVAFHEVGLYQIPAGPANRDSSGVPQSPAPNPDPNAPNNAWGRLSTDPDVVKALGRKAVMGSNEWKTHLDDQHAMGLAMLRGDYRQVVSSLPTTVQPTSPASAWGTWLMFMAFSAGPRGAASVASLFASKLAGVQENDRPSAHVHFAAQAIMNGSWKRTGSAARHSNPAHRLVRTWQKFQFASEVGKKYGNQSAVDFFTLRLGNQFSQHEDILVREEMLLSKPSGVTLATLY